MKKADLDDVRTRILNKYSQYTNSVYEMDSNCISQIFDMYDEQYFNNSIHKYMEENSFGLTFKTEGKYTFTTEGICIFKKCNYTITLPLHYFKVFNGEPDGVNVAGQNCMTQLEALLRVIEHEIVHLIMFIYEYNVQESEEHGETFMRLAHEFFGHTDHRHYMF